MTAARTIEGYSAAQTDDPIATIKAFAETSDDPNVYVIADVPPPAHARRASRHARPAAWG